MESIILDIIISEFDSYLGPTPVFNYGETLDKESINQIASKTHNYLFSEHIVTNNTYLFEFTNLEKKGLIRGFQWRNPSFRGGFSEGCVSIIFEERYDAIFYKYKDDFEPIVSKFVSVILEKKRKDPLFSDFKEDVKDLLDMIVKLLDNLSDLENQIFKKKEFPDKKTSEMEAEYVFKILIVGDPSVGKTSTVLKYTNKAFHRSYIPTIGVNIATKNIVLNEKSVQLIVWDLGGQAKFMSVRNQFYSGADAIIFVFDLTNSNSLKSIPKWIKDLELNLSDFKLVSKLLCGNKSDLHDSIIIPLEIIQSVSKEYKLDYFITSALTGQNNEKMFEFLVNDIMIRKKKKILESIEL